MSAAPDFARRDALLDAAERFDDEMERALGEGRVLDARAWSRAAFNARVEAESFAAEQGLTSWSSSQWMRRVRPRMNWEGKFVSAAQGRVRSRGRAAADPSRGVAQPVDAHD